MTTPLLFPEEPSRFTGRDAERLLVWCTEQGASDITIQSGEQVFLEIHGRMRRVTRKRLTLDEVMEIIVAMYGTESAKAKLSGDQDVDFGYEIKPDRERSFRFRVNATPINENGHRGVQVTARTILSLPPELSSLGVEPDIVENMAPKQGMVVITGGTGSGKSTLLSAILRSLIEQEDGHRKILTYEAPIEFVYDEVANPSTSISQTEIPTHLPSFAAAIRNALRRKPSIILVGEARDTETIGEAINASMTGHLLYTTVHSNGFADTIRRMVNVFPSSERNSRAVDIVSSLRMVVSQQLVPSTDGKRVALREYVVFDDDVVDALLDAGPDNITSASRRVLLSKGRSFLVDAEQKFREGRIDARTLAIIQRGHRAADRDAAD